jgi:hypothetical protein
MRGLRLPLILTFINGVLMITWKRPTGSIIETNERDETIKHAVSLGWEPVKPKNDKPVKPVKLKKDKPVKETVEETVKEKS